MLPLRSEPWQTQRMKIAVILIVLICATPTVAANLWPRLAHMWAEGGATGAEVGLTVALALSALGMTTIPFAMKKAGSLGLCLACLVMGTVLAAFNYTMAVEVATKWREDLAIPRAQTVAKSGALRARITGATNARAQLAQVPPASTAALLALAALARYQGRQPGAD